MTSLVGRSFSRGHRMVLHTVYNSDTQLSLPVRRHHSLTFSWPSCRKSSWCRPQSKFRSRVSKVGPLRNCSKVQSSSEFQTDSLLFRILLTRDRVNSSRNAFSRRTLASALCWSLSFCGSSHLEVNKGQESVVSCVERIILIGGMKAVKGSERCLAKAARK